MVDSVPVNAVQLLPDKLPVAVTYSTPTVNNILHQPAADMALYTHLGKVLRLSTEAVKCPVVGVRHSPRLAPIPCVVAQQVAQQSFAPVTVAINVPTDVSAYLQERSSEFPGVQAARCLPAAVSARPPGGAGARHRRSDQRGRDQGQGALSGCAGTGCRGPERPRVGIRPVPSWQGRRPDCERQLRRSV